MSRSGAEAAFALFVLTFVVKPLLIQEKCAFCLATPFLLLEPCVLSVATWSLKPSFLSLSWEITEAHPASAHNDAQSSTLETQVHLKLHVFPRIDSQRHTWRSEQIRCITPQACSHTHGQACSSISVFYNRWGNHRCALMRAAEAAQVVGTALPLCACVAVDFKDTTFVSEWKSYELPLSTWDVQLSPGMQQR